MILCEARFAPFDIIRRLDGRFEGYESSEGRLRCEWWLDIKNRCVGSYGEILIYGTGIRNWRKSLKRGDQGSSNIR